MRFVEDDRANLRQNTRIRRVVGLLLDREIGEKQMVIDDDDVALHCPAVHFRDETFIPRAALLANASVGACVDLVPERAGLGQFREFRPVSGLRRFLPRGNCTIVLDLFQTAQHRLAG